MKDMLSPRLHIEDVSDYDAMGYDAAPRVAPVMRYMMTQRPFSIGTQPKPGFVGYEESELPKRDSGYYGILTYSRLLTTEEIKRYELVEM